MAILILNKATLPSSKLMFCSGPAGVSTMSVPVAGRIAAGVVAFFSSSAGTGTTEAFLYIQYMSEVLH